MRFLPSRVAAVRFSRRIAIGLASFALLTRSVAAAPDAATPPAPAPAPNATALEALQRLKGMDLEANPALKGAVLRVLGSTRGTAAFVEIVRDFHLADQEDGLIEVAEKLPADAAGAEAVRLVLGAGRVELLAGVLREGRSEHRAALTEALARSGDRAAVPLLASMTVDSAVAGSVRSVAARGLAGSEDGARELLRLGRAGRLDDAVRTTASLALAQSRWPAIRTEAAQVFPLPRAADGAELPPVPELVQARGDAERGRDVFRSEKAACSKCHRVGADGADFGPALGQIGTKLGRQALYEAILDPSAGISFGFEGWDFELKNGDELSGLIASETADEWTLKQPNGAPVRIAKANVVRRTPQKLSVMPAGLGQLLTRRELVDVVEYLTTLKAP